MMRVVDTAGRRLYLSEAERQAFLHATRTYPQEVQTFCLTLLYTGCRISEALALTTHRVDHQAGMLIFKSLKKRQPDVYRAVPVPADLLDAIAELPRPVDGCGNTAGEDPDGDKVWTWCRKTGYRHIKRVMRDAGITGPQACPKGLRHGLGVACVGRRIALNMVQKWLGHASLSTTAIYADAVGEEERNIAAWLWS